MKQWWIVIVLAAVLIALAVWGVSRQSSSVPSPQASSTPEIISGVPSVQYTNKQFGFSMWYPQTASPSEVNFEGYVPLTQTSVISFVLPRAMFDGTNLTEAGVYIGATTSPAIVSSCTKASRNADEKAAGRTKINGADFSIFTSTGVGAGNIYETKSYRRLLNGACLEIAELLHSGNIGNYTPGAVKEFDHTKFSGILEAIIHTYRSI